MHVSEAHHHQEEARKFFAGPCDFVAGAATVEMLPRTIMPEIAVIGRSNVGKSSLLNTLTTRTQLARVSHTPGRTQQINFFSLRDQLMLVDLPGYGFAKTSKKNLSAWHRLIHDYLRGRPQLQRGLVLIDARVGMKQSDGEVMDYLDKLGVNYQIVLTKTDKVSEAACQLLLAEMQETVKRHPAAHPVLLPTSSVSRKGIEALQMALYSVLLHTTRPASF